MCLLLLPLSGRLFESTSKAHPEDSELQLALGVLHHLNRCYDAAIAAFQRALELRPGDYRWRKTRVWLAGRGRCAVQSRHGRRSSRCHAAAPTPPTCV